MANDLPSNPGETISNLPPFPNFCYTIGMIPTSYKNSLTYEEQLMWLCNFLENTVIPTVNNNGNAVTELQNLYVELRSFVDNYFTNLDVQKEINNKLDAMAASGALDNIFQPYLANFEHEINNKIASLASGSPKGTYATVADLKSTNPDHTYIYVVIANGNWYYWNNTDNDWVSGGIYQATAISETDPVISKLQDAIVNLGKKEIPLPDLEPYQLGVILDTGVTYNENFVRTNFIHFNQPCTLKITGNAPRIRYF